MQSTQARIEALEHIIDTRIMAQKAKEVGLEQDPIFKARYGEFSKTRLINIHRGRLIASWEPTEEEIRAFYKANEDRMIVKEVRKVQMLVVETNEQAETLKQQIEAPRAVTTNQRMSPIDNAIDTWMVGSANATGVKFDI